MKTMTVQLLWPSGLVVTLPEGAPVPRVGELYEHRIWEDPRQEGSRWRTRARLRRGVVARVRWSTDVRGSDEHTFAVAVLRAAPRRSRLLRL